MNLPKTVRIREVGPRDGFQMEREFIPTATKIEIINALVRTGLCLFEATSFVSPRAIPQMRDAAQVLAGIDRHEGMEVGALVPNIRGAEDAAAAGVDEIVLLVSASESHNRSNINQSIEGSLRGFETMAEIASEAGITVRGSISVVFGCPFEGNVPVENVDRIVERMAALGITAVTLGDTTGMATPPIVRRVCRSVMDKYPGLEIGLHFHNTRGLGLVNVYEALGMGFDIFESSIGGLGGCPFAPGATGNVCTEDLVYMMEELGLETGIDLVELIRVAKKVEETVGRELPGQVMKSGRRLDLYPPLLNPLI
ncbi:MAG: hydroxymethylglutaryl-CoA lyase [Deltaproteobacteria bacterium]|nr:hydroxymethylglutaryl-CoA lyase [Deltaproteobacteria bacterium]MBW2110082.1 hydroxymethylglutaryl-CoA lyase [Deltaproteobacteria bacterium]